MARMREKYGLLVVDIKICVKTEEILIRDVVVDTGASHSLINSRCVEDFDFFDFSNFVGFNTYIGLGGHKSHSAQLIVDSFSINELTLKDMKLDFGTINDEDEINGLLGLDFLKNLGVNIDLKTLSLSI